MLQFVVLGGQILISFPARYAWVLSGSGAAFRNLRGAGTAQVGAAAGWQGVVIVERIIASFLPAGTLTALNYGFKIMSSLAELLGGSVGTATLPALSSAVARRAHEEEHKTFRDTLEISLALVAPATVFCLMLDRNIIRLIFERGNFTPEATALMSLVFFYYSLSLVLYSFIRVLTFYLFARNEFGAFFRLSMLLYALNVGFDLLFVGALRLGAIGIPLGLLASLILTCGLLVHRNLAGLRMILDRSLASYALKNLLGSILAALAVWSLRPWLELPSTEAGNFLYLCVLCGTGSLAFFATLAASRAVPIAHLATVWRSSDDT